MGSEGMGSEEENTRKFDCNGWTFESHKNTALSSSGRLDLSEKYGLPHVPLPEMLFKENVLVVTHQATGWRVLFCAEDALQTWACEQKVNKHIQATEYDFMYGCHYRGSLVDSLHVKKFIYVFKYA